MAKRLNDTKGLTREFSGDVSHTVSTRKIDNGYLIRRSSSNDHTGEYSSSETFSAAPPKVNPPSVSRGNPAPDQGSPLKGAMEYLKGSK